MKQIDIPNIFALTIDLEWAPEFAIKKVVDFLVEKKVKCTWFITHDSKEMRKLFLYPEFFEIGVHPNFLPNTTQGKNEDEIISNLLKIAPNAVSFRTHALYQHDYMYQKIIEKYNFKNDSSVILNDSPHIVPHKLCYSKGGKQLIRLPLIWEDDFNCYDNNAKWEFSEKTWSFPGLKIFDFHPLYLYLNINSMDGYEELKKQKDISKLSVEDVEPYINKEKGDWDFFAGFVDFLSKRKTYTIAKISEMYEKGELK